MRVEAWGTSRWPKARHAQQEHGRAQAQGRAGQGSTASLSACIGLLPAAISMGIGSQVQRPLATVIVAGMLVGPILLLVTADEDERASDFRPSHTPALLPRNSSQSIARPRAGFRPTQRGSHDCRSREAALRCRSSPIDKLDRVVADHIEHRLLQPASAGGDASSAAAPRRRIMNSRRFMSDMGPRPSHRHCDFLRYRRDPRPHRQLFC